MSIKLVFSSKEKHYSFECDSTLSFSDTYNLTKTAIFQGINTILIPIQLIIHYVLKFRHKRTSFIIFQRNKNGGLFYLKNCFFNYIIYM